MYSISKATKIAKNRSFRAGSKQSENETELQSGSDFVQKSGDVRVLFVFLPLENQDEIKVGFHVGHEIRCVDRLVEEGKDLRGRAAAGAGRNLGGTDGGGRVACGKAGKCYRIPGLPEGESMDERNDDGQMIVLALRQMPVRFRRERKDDGIRLDPA